MSKKIVVITGSPRSSGNSFAMTDALVRTLETRGHTVTRFDAAQLNVAGCRACNTCYSTGKACSFDDDFNQIAPALEATDAVVFTTPVYWYTFPAQIKAVLDKMYAFVVGGRGITGKECALITCCEERDVAVMDGVLQPYQRAAALMQWRSLGEVLIPGVLSPGDIEKTDGVAQAVALAERF